MNVRWGFALATAALVLAGTTGRGNADVIYDWQTISASIGGAPTDVTAAGNITLTDAAFSRGAAQIASAPLGPALTYTFDGIATIGFYMFMGPDYAASAGDTGNVLFNVAVVASGDRLDFAGGNQRFGGFAVDRSDTDAYFAIGHGDLWTIGYGSDNPANPCSGSQIPGSGTNRCVVTGVFEEAQTVPEPGTLPLLLTGLVLWRVIARLDEAMTGRELRRGRRLAAAPAPVLDRAPHTAAPRHPS